MQIGLLVCVQEGFSASTPLRPRYLMLRPPTGLPRLGPLEHQSDKIFCQVSELHSYRSILQPLVLDPPREPLARRRSAPILFRILGFSHRFCYHRAFVFQRTQLHRVPRSREEDERPSLEFGLFARWRSAPIVRHDRRVDDRGCTYTTRCIFDLSMPPLNKASASPMLQIACPGIGYPSGPSASPAHPCQPNTSP
jgi:hypothetical protein